jgi:hypothetical protein
MIESLCIPVTVPSLPGAGQIREGKGRGVKGSALLCYVSLNLLITLTARTNVTYLLFSTVAGPDINLLCEGSAQNGGSLCSIDFFFQEVGVNLIATITYFLQKMVLFGKCCTNLYWTV